MWRKRLVFTALFALGSILAGAGWMVEFRGLTINLTWALIAGHGLQVVGAFGLLLIPDEEDESESPP